MKKIALVCFILISTSIYGFKHFILIASPGSGKGTLSRYLVERHGYVHVCPGDIFRNEIRLQTELGKKIKSTVEKGEYVDKKIVCELMEVYLKEILKENQLFILDGFPRAKVSFDFLHKFLKEHDLQDNVCFLQLDAEDEVCKKRILSRLVCPGCFKVYNSKYLLENKCKECGTGLIVRKGDVEEIIDKRLKFFHSEIEPLIDIAREYYEVQILNTECSLQDLEEKYENLAE